MSNFTTNSNAFPVSTLALDPTGVASTNLINNEVTTPITEPDVVTNQGPFYQTSIVVTGIPVGSTTHTALVYAQDYVYGPSFTDLSLATGLWVSSYILLTNYSSWSSIYVTYQAVGGTSTDLALATEINAAGSFDRTNILNWFGFTGVIATLPPGDLNYSLQNVNVVYLLSQQLSAIATALQTPSSYVNYINTTVNPLVSTVSGLQTQINNLLTLLNNNVYIPLGISLGTTIQYVTGTSATVLPAITPTNNTGTNIIVLQPFNTASLSTTVPTATLNLPSAPANGNIFEISFAQPITSLTVSGGTILKIPTGSSITAGTHYFLRYDVTNSFWA